MKKTVLIGVALSCFVLPITSMATVYVDASGMVGSRSTDDGGVVGYGLWDGITEGNNGFKIAWEIDGSTPGNYHYTYYISGVGAEELSKELSHWTLEVTYPASIDDFTAFSTSMGNIEGPRWFETDAGDSNIGQPADMFGIKFDAELYTVSFDTWRAPVWGDFYAKDGNMDPVTYAYNAGFGLDPTGPFTDWIARPNGDPIPEPATMFLFGTGLVGLAGARLRKKKV